jgi:ribosomal protein S18 acetylase RimI-like enzyme
MTPPMTIQPAQASDASRLSAFAHRMFHETFGPLNTPENMNVYLSSAFNEARQLAEIENPNAITLLADSDSTLIGFAHLQLGDVPACVSDRHAIELVRFYVDPALHGRGVAQTLMRQSLAAASARASSVWLGVWERNARAIAFYGKCGFHDVGSHDFMLGTDRQTDRIMWRPTDDPPPHGGGHGG